MQSSILDNETLVPTMRPSGGTSAARRFAPAAGKTYKAAPPHSKRQCHCRKGKHGLVKNMKLNRFRVFFGGTMVQWTLFKKPQVPVMPFAQPQLGN